MMILNVLQELLERGVKVIAIKEGYELGDNIQSKVLAFAFGLSAEIERTLLSESSRAATMDFEIITYLAPRPSFTFVKLVANLMPAKRESR